MRTIEKKRKKEEKDRKDAEEKEKLLREAKQQEAALKKGKIDTQQSIELREKIKQARIEEDEQKRASQANQTALAAIGDIGRKSKPLYPSFMQQVNFTPQQHAQLKQLQVLQSQGVLLPAQQEQLRQLLLQQQAHQRESQNRTQLSKPEAKGILGPTPKYGLPPTTIELMTKAQQRRITKRDVLYYLQHDRFAKSSKLYWTEKYISYFKNV